MGECVRMIVEELNGVAGSKVGSAARYGVSRKTLYKWLKRFEAGSCTSNASQRVTTALPLPPPGWLGPYQLSVWWVRLGIRLERIEPGQPQNGRHERAHRGLKEQTASPPAANLTVQQQAFARFAPRVQLGPTHEALGQQKHRGCITSPSLAPFRSESPSPSAIHATGTTPRQPLRSHQMARCTGADHQGPTGQDVGFKPVTRLRDPTPFEEEYAI